jgi:hypothetical protein
LEHALAEILEAIERIGAFDPEALATLLRRKQAICATLAAPEQSWQEPRAEPPAAGAQRKAA